MSSVAQFTVGGGGMAAVQTLTGNTGGAVGPTANNINIVGSGFVTVTGNPGTSTLTISVSNSGSNVATTVGLVTVNIISVPVADSEMVTITAVINGLRDTFADCWGGSMVFTVYRPTGGDVTIAGALLVNANTTSTADVTGTVDIVGENALINVVGVAGQTWNWSASYQVFYQP